MAVIGPVTEICPVATSVLALMLLPMLKLPSVIDPVATRSAAPVTLAAPLCVRVPLKLTARLVVLMTGKARFTPEMLRLSSDLVEPITPPRLTAPAPALMVR